MYVDIKSAIILVGVNDENLDKIAQNKSDIGEEIALDNCSSKSNLTVPTIYFCIKLFPLIRRVGFFLTSH